jgi:hypothetical protein
VVRSHCTLCNPCVLIIVNATGQFKTLTDRRLRMISTTSLCRRPDLLPLFQTPLVPLMHSTLRFPSFVLRNARLFAGYRSFTWVCDVLL